MKYYQKSYVVRGACGHATSNIYARKHDGLCKACATGVGEGKPYRTFERRASNYTPSYRDEPMMSYSQQCWQDRQAHESIATDSFVVDSISGSAKMKCGKKNYE